AMAVFRSGTMVHGQPMTTSLRGPAVYCAAPTGLGHARRNRSRGSRPGLMQCRPYGLLWLLITQKCAGPRLSGVSQAGELRLSLLGREREYLQATLWVSHWAAVLHARCFRAEALQHDPRVRVPCIPEVMQSE